jgi:calpain-7
MLKLHLNGVARKVLIDDRLPVDTHGRLLCSFSTLSGELWVSLLEKAFLRAMGGYDFPGSNSGVDLHVLTGWLPERVTSQSLQADPGLAERTWARLLSGHKFGDCLLTAATGELSPQEESRQGLVATHAYALLRLEEVEGLKLLQIKNPWTHTRWRGRFGPDDSQSWTPGLQERLQYDRAGAAQQDNGVFWIDLEALLSFFKVLYVSWNPALFKFRISAHDVWPLAQGPRKDAHSFQFNPQFAVSVASVAGDAKLSDGRSKGKGGASLWLLLARHITVREEKDNDFITLHVYEANEGQHKNYTNMLLRPGARVYCPRGARLPGTYINNPLYLAQLELEPGPARVFTVVISQLEKTRDMAFSLHVCCTVPVALVPVPLQRAHRQQLSGTWRVGLSGGCSNHGRFGENPQYLLTVRSPGLVLFLLQAPKTFFVNVCVMLSPSREAVERQLERDVLYSSGAYAEGFTALEADIPAGEYVVVVSTFSAGQTGAFFLTLEADGPLPEIAVIRS